MHTRSTRRPTSDTKNWIRDYKRLTFTTVRRVRVGKLCKYGRRPKGMFGRMCCDERRFSKLSWKWRVVFAQGQTLQSIVNYAVHIHIDTIEF